MVMTETESTLGHRLVKCRGQGQTRIGGEIKQAKGPSADALLAKACGIRRSPRRQR